MKKLKKFFDYESNPVLFLIWSYSYQIYELLEGEGLVGPKKRRPSFKKAKS